MVVHKGLPFPATEPTAEQVAEAREVLGLLCWGDADLTGHARERVEDAYMLLGGDAYVACAVAERDER